MFETVVWVSLILGFFAITIFALASMLIIRQKEQVREQIRSLSEIIEKIDQATNASLTEINKTAGLSLHDINEKYQSMLFLYNLLEEKKKDIISIGESVSRIEIKNTPPLQKDLPEPAPAAADSKRAFKPLKPNPKHEKIILMHENGLNTRDIAKELDMGQGEVQLIIDLNKNKA